MKNFLLIFIILSSNLVIAQSRPTAKFSANPKIGCSVPHTVFFTDESINANSWNWYFGDGGYSNDPNPAHTYSSRGVFIVELTVGHYGLYNTYFDTIKIIPPIADFIGNPKFGCAPVQVDYTDMSLSSAGIDSWEWVFGDGGISTDQNPSNTYDQPGLYTVSLKVTDNNGCENTKTRNTYIQVIGPDVDFSADQLSICSGSTVQFTDLTTFGAPIISWTWDFGDGLTSNFQNPNHIYNATGNYTVSLAVSDIDGCSRTYTQVDYIAVDLIAPTFSAPPNITIYSDANCHYDLDITNTGDVIDEADNCSVGEATYSDVLDETNPCSKIINRTWSLIDDAGNAAANQVQTISIEDNTPPTFTAPTDITIYKDENCNYNAGVAITGDVTNEADNCEVGDATYADMIDDTDPCAIIITRTWSLEDNCGNAAADQVQTISIEDNTPPTFTAPTDITIYKDEICNYNAGVAITGDVTNEADNCEVGDATYADMIDDTDPCAIIITRTWSLEDNCGNAAADQVQTISIEDNIDPIAFCQDISIDLDPVSGLASIIPSDIDNGSSDNCTFTLSASQLDFDCSHIGPNIITLTVSDACGNTASCNATVTVNDITAPLITCPANQDLFIGESCEVILPSYETQLTANDACGIASIVQTPAAGTIFTGADAGIHPIEFTVTDLNDHVSSCTFDITIIDEESFTIVDVESTNVICNGDNNGTISLSTIGGLSGLFFSIDGIDYTNTTGLFTDLAPGTYTVSVKNTNDCLSTWTPDIVITEPSLLEIEDVIILDVMGCYGEQTGEIEIIASGGSPAYLYSINNGEDWQTSNLFTNLSAGNYDIKIKDTHNCITSWGIVEISQPSQLLLWDVDMTHITSCYGDLQGEIHIDAGGGTGILSYSIDEGNTWLQNNGDFTALAAGFYFVQIMDENECIYILSTPQIITQPVQLVVNTVTQINVSSCFGNSNAVIDISANGGTGDILYSIDGGNSFFNNNGLFENLTAGTYNIFITDENDCLSEYAENPIVIEQPTQITMMTISTNVEGCAGNNNGSISITATGGTGIYTYSIDGGINWTSNSDFEELFAGSYTVMTKDNHECIQSYDDNPLIITEPESIVYSDVLFTDNTCFQSEDGTITISASGGTGSLAYSINDGESFQSTALFTNLAAGEYYLIIIDNNNCEMVYENNPVVIEQPNEIMITNVEAVDEGCNGIMGSIVISAQGGSGSLLYSINNGLSYQVSNVFNNLQENSYIIRVKDGLSCTELYANNPVVIQQESIEVSIEAYPNSWVCMRDVVSLRAISDEAVSYLWDHEGETTQEIEVSQESPGLYYYQVEATGVLGCTSIASAYIIVKKCSGTSGMWEISPISSFDESIEITAKPSNEVCMGEVVELEAWAQDAIQYEWIYQEESGPIAYVSEAKAGSYFYPVVTVFTDTAIISGTEINFQACTGLTEQESGSIRVYPNPNAGLFTVSITDVKQEVEIRVLDFAGRLILEDKISDINNGKIEKQFNFKDFERGVYFMRITIGDKISYRKVVIQ